MKTRFLYLFPLAMLLWGCPGQSEEEPAPQTQQGCLMQEQSRTLTFNGHTNPTFTNRFSYNSQNQLTAVALDSAGIPIDNATLTYDSNNRLAEVSGTRTRLVNGYNAQNQLARQTRYNSANGQERDYYTFSYNSKNELAEARYYYSGSGTAQLFYTWKYSYTNGNPTRIEQLSAQGERMNQTVLTFDSRLSPQPLVAFSFFNPAEAPAAHNITGYNLTATNGGTSSYNISYTYNEKGFPVTATKAYSSIYQEETSYTYSCL